MKNITAAKFNKLVNTLDGLLDIIGSNENHPLMGQVDIVSNIIEKYEAKRFPVEQEKGTGAGVLKFLMECHHLSKSDLPEVGSQKVVAEILNGKRQLNVKQVTLLSKRFYVDPATFSSLEEHYD